MAGDGLVGARRAHRLSERFQAAIAPYALLIVLLFMAVGFSLLLPDIFPTLGNLSAMLNAQAILLILGLAVTLPLRAGDFDLSIAATMLLSAITTGILTAHLQIPFGLAIIASLCVGLAVGAINGTLIVVVGIDAFITTLGMQTILEGIGYAFTSSQQIYGIPMALQNVVRFPIFGLPAVVYTGWILGAILFYVYQFTPFGRHLLFVGGNREAARLAGVAVRRTRFMAFTAAAVMAAIAGVLLVGALGAVDPSAGPLYLLQPYAAAFLGTTVIQIGRFNVLGTIIGLYLLIVGVTGLELMGAPSWVAEVFNGSALVAAVIFAHVTARHAPGQHR